LTQAEQARVTQQPDNDRQSSERQPRTVRLPVFVSDEPVGLGDVVKRATSTFGIKPCGGCAQRAARLNSRVAFTGRRK
jgi:hypothetical protein